MSSGPGWFYDAAGHYVEVDGNGAVLSGLYVRCDINIAASNVTVRDVRIVTSGPSSFGISLRHTSGVTIENSRIGGINSTSGRVAYAIDDLYGDSTGMVIKNNNISNWRTAVQVSSGLVVGNYIHNPGYRAGDHTNGIYDAGSTQPLTIERNTIFNSLGQTDDITLEASDPGRPVANKTIKDNLLAGGGYAIYGGAGKKNSTSNIVIMDNRFSKLYYRHGGKYGPVAYFNSSGRGNIWAGNIWSTNIGSAKFQDGIRRARPVPAP